MHFPELQPLLGAWIDNFQIQLGDKYINWLTPIWILCVGALLGLAASIVLWLVAALLSKIPAIGMLAEKRTSSWIATAVLTVLLFGGALVALPMLEQRPEGAQPQAVDQNPPAGEGRPTALTQTLNRGGSLVSVLAVCFFLAMALVAVVSKRSIDETGLALTEGVLYPFSILLIAMSVFAIFGVTVVRKPSTLISSLVRYPELSLGTAQLREYEIEAPPADFTEPPTQEIDVFFRKDEIKEIVVSTNQRVEICTEPFESRSLNAAAFSASSGEDGVWRRIPNGFIPFADEEVTKLYIRNFGTKTADVKIKFRGALAHPEILAAPTFAMCAMLVYLLYFLQRSAFPKMAAIAHATAKSDISHPFFLLLTGIGVFALFLFVWVSYFTLGEDIKMLKDSSLSTILVLSIVQAVFSASTSLSEEIEGKTALTVLSKPVSRRDFVLGKFIGIAWTVGLMCVILGLWMLVWVAFKPVYEARESSEDIPTWQNCYAQMMQIVPGLVLAFMEALVMAAISIAISTRLPMLPNFLICFSIYVLGHLTPLLVQSQSVAEHVPQPVVFLAKWLATILPALDHFNIQASIAAGVEVPLLYLAWAGLYCVVYSTIAMLLALTLFEDRDLA